MGIQTGVWDAVDMPLNIFRSAEHEHIGLGPMGRTDEGNKRLDHSMTRPTVRRSESMSMS